MRPNHFSSALLPHRRCRAEISLWLLASAKSIGALLVSAKVPIKKIKNTGNKGRINQIGFWDSTITLKFKLFVNIITINKTELKTNS